MARTAQMDIEAFIEALQELDGALDENIERAQKMKERIRELMDAHSQGRSLTEMLPEEDPPLIVQLLTESSETLASHGNRVRRTEASALHREGMTMDQIAALFGVTRQRISALLRES
jgi:DNA-directed RNA polymerase sigma subunit (sigma70/sigma32)